jgi:hypothetical protein
MNTNIQDSLVNGFEYLIPTLELPDLDDRHVLAAAIIAYQMSRLLLVATD